MRAWLVHAAFAIILLGSLAARGQSDVLDESASLEPAVISVARSQGLVFRHHTAIAHSDLDALVFEAPGCPRPILLVVLMSTFDQDPILRSAREQGDMLRYIYIDNSWKEPDHLAVMVGRLKYSALAIFGLTPYLPSWHLLAVESPESCQAVDRGDWRNVWKRDYVKAAAAPRSALLPPR
jgi:hypothetical protein